MGCRCLPSPCFPAEMEEKFAKFRRYLEQETSPELQHLVWNQKNRNFLVQIPQRNHHLLRTGQFLQQNQKEAAWVTTFRLLAWKLKKEKHGRQHRISSSLAGISKQNHACSHAGELGWLLGKETPVSEVLLQLSGVPQRVNAFAPSRAA